MTRYLTFISLIILLSSCSPKLATTSSINESGKENNGPAYKPVVFRSVIQFGNNAVTGLMIIKKRADDSVCGSFTNEFGVKGFDFIYSDNKVDLVYVMPMLDRYLIKRTLKEDIRLLVRYGFSEINDSVMNYSQKSSRVVYLLAKKSMNSQKVKISLESGNNAAMLFLEDFRHMLTIKLVTIDSDEK